MIETMKKKILQCFNQIREYENVHKPSFSLGSHKLEVSLDDEFEYTIFPRFDIALTNNKDLPISLLSDIPSETSNPRDVTDDVLIKHDLPIPFTQPYGFQEGKNSKGC